MRILFFLCLLNVSVVFSQEKIEREYRVKLNEVPQKSVKIIKMWDFKKNVKWYKEESQDGKTYEAKVCYQKHKYSIEFDEKGELLDVEKTIKFKRLSKAIQEKINSTLSKEFEKFRIKKTQIQFTGSENAIYRRVFDLKNNEQVEKHYEIIISGKKNNNYKRYEVLLNENGKLIKILPFADDNNDNLEF